MSAEKQYWGKYQGTVFNNVDPELRGRIQAIVPDISSVIPTTFAEACVPLAGPTGPPMGVYMVPPIGAGVWIEFEHGDPNKPIWTGCRWGGQSDVPPLAHAGLPVSPNIVIQTAGQNSFIISDVPGPTGGILLKSSTGLSTIMLNDTGITITGPMINITAITPAGVPGPVTINGGALVVT